MDWLTAILVWLSSDNVALDKMEARAAAAVDCAYASIPRAERGEEKQEKPAAARVSGGKPASNCPTGNCPLPRR